MKQHDLLKLLCLEFPNIFVVTKDFKAKKVFINDNKSLWVKEISFTRFESAPVSVLSQEILNDYRKAKLS